MIFLLRLLYYSFKYCYYDYYYSIKYCYYDDYIIVLNIVIMITILGEAAWMMRLALSAASYMPCASLSSLPLKQSANESCGLSS